jgi:threonine dehydratase
LIDQLPNLDIVYVAVGGGGLISGIGLYLKSIKPTIQIIACYPSASPVMAECMKANKIVDYECTDTISEATAGGIEPGAITLALCQAVVDRSILVEEDQTI